MPLDKMDIIKREKTGKQMVAAEIIIELKSKCQVQVHACPATFKQGPRRSKTTKIALKKISPKT